jgi:hypothetical protein
MRVVSDARWCHVLGQDLRLTPQLGWGVLENYEVVRKIGRFCLWKFRLAILVGTAGQDLPGREILL